MLPRLDALTAKIEFGLKYWPVSIPATRPQFFLTSQNFLIKLSRKLGQLRKNRFHGAKSFCQRDIWPIRHFVEPQITLEMGDK